MTAAEIYVAGVLATPDSDLTYDAMARALRRAGRQDLNDGRRIEKAEARSALTEWLRNTDTRWLHDTERDLPQRVSYREAWS